MSSTYMPLSHLSACRYPRLQYNIGQTSTYRVAETQILISFSVVPSLLGFVNMCSEMFWGYFPFLKFHTSHTLTPRFRIKNHWMISAVFITEQFSKTFYENVKRVEFIQACLVSRRKKSSISIPYICMFRNSLFDINAYIFLWITKKGIW